MIQQTIPQRFVGIDMDSISFDLYLKTPGKKLGEFGKFMTTQDGLKDFIQWVHDKNDPIISLEGYHGQNLILEQALNKAHIPFYSIPPFNVSKFREANISRNKNNRTDAMAVASFALNQFVQGDLDKFRSTEMPDFEVRTLTRRYHQISKLVTSEYSNLWKYLKMASSDLYVAFKGKHPVYHFSAQCMQTKGILELLINHPDLNEWKSLSEKEFIEVMGGKCYVNRKPLIKSLKELAVLFNPVPLSLSIPISQAASNIRKYYRDKIEIQRALQNIAHKNLAISTLMKDKGMGILTASSIVAEIIDINRFSNDDKLASYTGLGRTENKTGTNEHTKRSISYNRYLKDAIITGAVHHLMKNKESGYTKYYRQKINQGHSTFYARKALARALLRRIYRILKEVEKVKKIA